LLECRTAQQSLLGKPAALLENKHEVALKGEKKSFEHHPEAVHNYVQEHTKQHYFTFCKKLQLKLTRQIQTQFTLPDDV